MKPFVLHLFLAVLVSSCGAKHFESKMTELENENRQLKTKQVHLHQDIQELTDTLMIIESKLDTLSYGRPVAKKEFLETPIGQFAPSKAVPKNAQVGRFEKTSTPRSFLGEGIDIDPSKSPVKKEQANLVLTNQHLDAPSKQAKTARSEQKPRSKKQSVKPIQTKAEEKVNQEDQKVIDHYRAAYELFLGQKYDEAIAQMQNFVKAYPAHRYTDNAVYWMGEGYYQKNDYLKASQAFSTLLKDYPDGNKVPDALLRAGICYVKMEKIGQAKESFNTLLKDYPESMAAKKAKATLEGI
ncbi:MAG: tol-pal system protein YbgF [Bdellovibrionales bacterium]|nr:tol-pal system protein YbgF [Bdellovibrionales bacterium]